MSSYNHSLTVPAAITTGASDVTVLENSDATFTCIFEANPTPGPTQYMWQFTDSTGTTVRLINDEKYVILSSNGDNSFTTTLTITSAIYDDRGTYNCSATNNASNFEYTNSGTASLTVYGEFVCITRLQGLLL